MADLSIKRADVHEMARLLAERHKTSMAEIVAEALREKIEREDPVKSGPSPEELVARWLKITDDLTDKWKEPWKSAQHGDLLYDEHGLPK